MNRADRVVFMRLRVTEIRKHAIALVAGDNAFIANKDLSCAFLKVADDVAQILEVELLRQRR